MTDLLERLRAATVGTPELAAEVLNAVHGRKPDAYYEVTDVVSRANSYRVVVRVTGRPGWDGASQCANVAESIDAAWALAEAMGFDISISAWWRGESEESSVRVYTASIPSRDIHRMARTPALAICAALVAAQESQQ